MKQNTGQNIYLVTSPLPIADTTHQKSKEKKKQVRVGGGGLERGNRYRATEFWWQAVWLEKNGKKFWWLVLWPQEPTEAKKTHRAVEDNHGLLQQKSRLKLWSLRARVWSFEELVMGSEEGEEGLVLGQDGC